MTMIELISLMLMCVDELPKFPISILGKWNTGSWPNYQDPSCFQEGISYSYTIALSGLFVLYTRGGHLNTKAKPNNLKAHLECTS